MYVRLKFKSSICINHLINDVSFLDCFVGANVTFILVTEKNWFVAQNTHLGILQAQQIHENHLVLTRAGKIKQSICAIGEKFEFHAFISSCQIDFST